MEINWDKMYTIPKIVVCQYQNEKCCFLSTERGGTCKILFNTDFDDGECHFRKLTLNGENMYDKRKKEIRKEREEKKEKKEGRKRKKLEAVYEKGRYITWVTHKWVEVNE